MSWLHLVAGVSRDTSNRVLKVVNIMIRLVTAKDAATGEYVIPIDVRTAMKHLSIEPVIDRTICCPKCFRAYSLTDMPQHCLARDGNTTCSTPLWVERQTR